MSRRSEKIRDVMFLGVVTAALVYFLLVMFTGCQSPMSALKEENARLQQELADDLTRQGPASPLEPAGISDVVTKAVKDALDAMTPDPSETTPAQKSLWPYTWVGAVAMAWGVVHMILFRSPIALVIGAALSAVPFGVLYTSRSFLIPTSIGVGVITLVWMGVTVGTKLGLFKINRATNQAADDIFVRTVANPNLTPEERAINLETAKKLRWVGKPTFDPYHKDLPHEDSDPVNVRVLETPS